MSKWRILVKPRLIVVWKNSCLESFSRFLHFYASAKSYRNQFSSNSLEPFLWCLKVWDMERRVESEEESAQRTTATLVRWRWAPFKHEKIVWKKQKRKHSEDFFCWRVCLLLKVDCLTLWELVHSEDVCISESLWKPQATPHLLRRLALCAHGATQEANRWCLRPVLGWEA